MNAQMGRYSYQLFIIIIINMYVVSTLYDVNSTSTHMNHFLPDCRKGLLALVVKDELPRTGLTTKIIKRTFRTPINYLHFTLFDRQVQPAQDNKYITYATYNVNQYQPYVTFNLRTAQDYHYLHSIYFTITVHRQ